MQKPAVNAGFFLGLPSAGAAHTAGKMFVQAAVQVQQLAFASTRLPTLKS